MGNNEEQTEEIKALYVFPPCLKNESLANHHHHRRPAALARRDMIGTSWGKSIVIWLTSR
jgi:hypothetical protein